MKDKIMPVSFIPEGVLNSELVHKLHEEGVITRVSGERPDAECSSIDLHISYDGWKLKGSVKQIREDEDKKRGVVEICEKLKERKLKLDSAGLELEKESVYVFRLDESVDFSEFPWLYGEATGKSSIGRIDVLTRLIANCSPAYDYIPSGYKGPLYLEIIPISFNIKIYLGDSLNQLRIHSGDPEPLDPSISYRLLFLHDTGEPNFAYLAQNEGTLSVNLSPTIWGSKKVVALRAKEDVSDLIDLALHNIEPEGYFEPVESDDSHLLIKKNRFYILRSIERLALPEDIAVTGFAYTEHLGEVRIHYAGFAHPYFGMKRKDGKTGTPLIFEVRAHNFDVVLRHGENFAKILFYKMAEPIPEDERNPDKNYSDQELMLSKYFRNSKS